MIAGLRHWLHRRQRPQRHALLDRLLREQPPDLEQALRRREDDLRRIVQFAVANTDYYRERFARAGIDPAGAWTVGDLPLLAKEDVVRHLDALLVRNADRGAAKIGHTGGSTGKPLAFWYDEFKHELMRAGMMRSYMMSGWRPGQKILNFWGARQDTVAGGVFGSGWEDFVAAEKTIAAYEYTPAQLHGWAETIRAYRPVLLQGYASILAELARHVIDQRLPMPASLVGVYSTAEVLDDSQRELMARAFSCPVFNQYGSREIPNIACECRLGNMHVFTDMVYLESLPDVEGGERLIVTSLTNRLMPFLRYDIGDSGRLREGECGCGWPFPLMEMGMCRQNDLIRTPAAKTFHPSYFNRLLYGLTEIEQYQFVQEAPDRMVLNVVAPRLEDAVEERLRDAIRRDVDPGMEFRLNRVTEIPRTASGKHRFVVSRC